MFRRDILPQEVKYRLKCCSMTRMFRISIIAISLVAYFAQGCYCTDDEYRLITTLLGNYNVNVRPVSNQSASVPLRIGMAINQLIDLDERNEVVKLKAWMRYRWTDMHLTWNSSEYGGLSNIRILPKYIWKPDITLYTDLADTDKSSVLVYPIDVSSDGKMAWNVPQIIESTCSLDVTYFPWDEQRCALKFGSWTYDGFKLDLTNKSDTGDMAYFTKNGEWTFVAFPVKKHVEYYSCCVEPYPDVTFYMIIRRKPLYYLYNLILPCIFITATTVLVFYLPPESGEKVSLGVTVLLALTVFLLLVAEIMPPQSETIPVIGQYFGATIMLLALSTALTVIMLNVHHRGMFGNEVPFWIRKLVLDWMARPLCLKAKVDKNLSTSPLNKVQNAEEEKGNINNAMVVDDLEMSNHFDRDKEKNFHANQLSTTDIFLSKIFDIVKDVYQNHKQKDKLDACSTDWMLVAMVIDRLLLVVFFVLTIVVSSVILTNHPTYEDGIYSPVE